MAYPAVIELGTDFDPVEPGSRPLPLWWRRGWGLFGLAMAVLLGIGPPVRVVPGQVVPVAAIPSGGYIGYALSADTLYAAWFPYQAPAADPGRGIPEATHATLDAYRLSDGQLRWRVLLPVSTSMLTIMPAGTDTVVVSTLDPHAAGDRTVAYDASSGRLLWDNRLPVVPTVPAGRTVVLGAYVDDSGTPGPSPYTDSPDPAAPPPLQLQAIVARTGAVSWARRVPAGAWTALPGEVAVGEPDSDPYAVIVAPDGTATAVDLGTGTASAQAQIRVGPTRTIRGDEVGPTLVVTRGRLLVGYLDGGQPTLTSYRADTLAPQWTVPVYSLNIVAVPCAADTCLTDEQGTRAVDPATGQVAWSGISWQPVGMIGRWLYALPEGNRRGSTSLLAAGTGTPVLHLTGWALVPGPAAGPYLVHSTEPADQVVTNPGASWLGVIRSKAGVPRVDPLGPLVDASVNGCASVPGYVVCGTGDHRLRVWRYQE